MYYNASKHQNQSQQSAVLEFWRKHLASSYFSISNSSPPGRYVNRRTESQANHFTKSYHRDRTNRRFWKFCQAPLVRHWATNLQDHALPIYHCSTLSWNSISETWIKFTTFKGLVPLLPQRTGALQYSKKYSRSEFTPVPCTSSDALLGVPSAWAGISKLNVLCFGNLLQFCPACVFLRSSSDSCTTPRPARLQKVASDIHEPNTCGPWKWDMNCISFDILIYHILYIIMI